jgi:hypothetical protein
MPRAVTVWAVELGKDVQPDEIKGTLELGGDVLLFSPNDEARPAIRIALRDIAKVRRLRGSPVLMVERTTSSGSRKTAFYFAQPPPLATLLGAPVERPAGLAAFRNPKRKARRDNVGYLGLMNREKKAAISEWVSAVRAGVSKAVSGPDQTAPQS